MAELTKAKVRHCDFTSDLTRLICKISPDLLLGTTAKREFNTKVVSQGFVFDAGWLSIESLIRRYTCANSDKCDYRIVGDESEAAKKHPKKTDRNKFHYDLVHSFNYEL